MISKCFFCKRIKFSLRNKKRKFHSGCLDDYVYELDEVLFSKYYRDSLYSYKKLGLTRIQEMHLRPANRNVGKFFKTKKHKLYEMANLDVNTYLFLSF